MLEEYFKHMHNTDCNPDTLESILPPIYNTADCNPMLLDPKISQMHEIYKRRQSANKRSSRKKTETDPKRSRAVLYCSALNTGKIIKINAQKLEEHGVRYDNNAKRFIV